MLKYVLLAIVLAAGLLLVLRDKRPVSASAEIVVDAPIERVWALQTDLAGWQRWNTDIESMQVEGEVGPGAVFVWKAGGVTIRSTVTEFTPPNRVAWRGETIGLHANHRWEFAPTDAGVHVYTTEEFTGLLAWLLPGTMRGQLEKALQHGVYVLKAAAEAETGRP